MLQQKQGGNLDRELLDAFTAPHYVGSTFYLFALGADET